MIHTERSPTNVILLFRLFVFWYCLRWWWFVDLKWKTISIDLWIADMLMLPPISLFSFSVQTDATFTKSLTPLYTFFKSETTRKMFDNLRLYLNVFFIIWYFCQCFVVYWQVGIFMCLFSKWWSSTVQINEQTKHDRTAAKEWRIEGRRIRGKRRRRREKKNIYNRNTQIKHAMWKIGKQGCRKSDVL